MGTFFPSPRRHNRRIQVHLSVGGSAEAGAVISQLTINLILSSETRYGRWRLQGMRMWLKACLVQYSGVFFSRMSATHTELGQSRPKSLGSMDAQVT